MISEAKATPVRQGMFASLRERFAQRPDSEHQATLSVRCAQANVGLDEHEECRNSALIRY